MIGVQLNGYSAAAAGLTRVQYEVDRAEPGILDEAAQQFKSFWQLHLSGPASGNKLGVNTGGLRQSITVEKNGQIRRIAPIGSPQKYRTGRAASYDLIAAVHEKGATITAKRAPFLRFRVGKTGSSEWVQVKSVTIPARPHFKPAIDDAWPIIQDLLEDKTEDAIRKARASTTGIQDEQWTRAGDIAALGGVGRRTFQISD